MTPPESDLNIFIIGPVGAGKTVFSFMLNQHVVQHPEQGIAFKVGDWKTKAHLAVIGQALENQSWPPGTAPGNLTSLQWEWDFYGRQAQFTLIDPPGEDIEKELRGESAKLLILQSIRNADVIFVLLDLHEHQSEKHLKKTQNAWIVENVLRNAATAQRVVLGVSKGDLMTHLLPIKSWRKKTQVLDLIGSMMPEFNLNAFRSQLEERKVEVVLFSAVYHTEARLDGEEKLQRVPGLPLRSEGLDVFVKAITEGYSDKVWQRFWHKSKQWIIELICSRRFWLALFIAFLLYLLYWYCVSVF